MDHIADLDLMKKRRISYSAGNRTLIHQSVSSPVTILTELTRLHPTAHESYNKLNLSADQLMTYDT